VVPETVAPFAGLVMDTVGGVVSALFTVTAADAFAALPAESSKTAVIACEPFETDAVFQVQE
jgi:hypothetical protein